MAYSETSDLIASLKSAFKPDKSEATIIGKIAQPLALYMVKNFDMPGTKAAVNAVKAKISGDLKGMSGADEFPKKLSAAVTSAAKIVAGAFDPKKASQLIAPPVPPAYTFAHGDSAMDAATHIASVTAAYLVTGTWVGPVVAGSPTPGATWDTPPPDPEEETEEPAP